MSLFLLKLLFLWWVIRELFTLVDDVEWILGIKGMGGHLAIE